jgi:hypothetical protein
MLSEEGLRAEMFVSHRSLPPLQSLVSTGKCALLCRRGARSAPWYHYEYVRDAAGTESLCSAIRNSSNRKHIEIAFCVAP